MGLGDINIDTKDIDNILGKLIDAAKEVGKTDGFVVKRVPGVYDGKKGEFVWDYIIWNQITFDAEDGTIKSFFCSMSDKKAEKAWNELMSQYGV